MTWRAFWAGALGGVLGGLGMVAALSYLLGRPGDLARALFSFFAIWYGAVGALLGGLYGLWTERMERHALARGPESP